MVTITKMGRQATSRYNRGGRGGGSTSSRMNSRSHKTSSSSKKTMADYTFYLGTAKAASDFELTKEYLVNHIRKIYDTGDDIAKALETEAEFDLTTVRPTLKVSQDSDAGKKTAEDRDFKIEQAADMELFAK